MIGSLLVTRKPATLAQTRCNESTEGLLQWATVDNTVLPSGLGAGAPEAAR